MPKASEAQNTTNHNLPEAELQNNEKVVSEAQKPKSPFIDPGDLPKVKLTDGTEVKLKAGPWKKSRRVTNFSRKR